MIKNSEKRLLKFQGLYASQIAFFTAPCAHPKRNHFPHVNQHGKFFGRNADTDWIKSHKIVRQRDACKGNARTLTQSEFHYRGDDTTWKHFLVLSPPVKGSGFGKIWANSGNGGNAPSPCLPSDLWARKFRLSRDVFITFLILFLCHLCQINESDYLGIFNICSDNFKIKVKNKSSWLKCEKNQLWLQNLNFSSFMSSLTETRSHAASMSEDIWVKNTSAKYRSFLFYSWSFFEQTKLHRLMERGCFRSLLTDSIEKRLVDETNCSFTLSCWTRNNYWETVWLRNSSLLEKVQTLRTQRRLNSENEESLDKDPKRAQRTTKTTSTEHKSHSAR